MFDSTPRPSDNTNLGSTQKIDDKPTTGYILSMANISIEKDEPIHRKK